ncbi:MAG: tetratricopeptide repeat protein, partial [Candidatus Sumerlaeota bacterium]
MMKRIEKFQDIPLSFWGSKRRLLILAALFFGIAIALSSAKIAADEDVDIPDPNRYRMSKTELEVWNDADFQRQFIDSYKAETEIEPRVTENEREDMREIMEFISSDRMDKAEAMLVKELERNEAVSAVFDFTLANIYFQQDKLDEAATYYRSAVQKFQKFRRAWRNLAIIYVRESDFENARPALTKVIELGGGDSITFGLLGFTYSSLDNNLSAESAYRMAILMDPQTLDWKMGLARSFFKLERYAEAAALCGQLIRENPDRAELWLLQANAYIGQNKRLKAAENYELVDSLGKSSAESLMMLGDIYINEELYSLAVDAYIRSMKKFPDSKPDRAIRAAKALAARAANEETQKLLETIKELKSENLSEDEKKDMLKLQVRLAVAEGASEAEVRILEEIIKIDPLDGEALILLGQHARR